MLVLTRKLQEKIHIGANITITVVKIKGNTVRVGIEAPGDVRVVRGEVAIRDETGVAGGIPTACETQTTPPPTARPCHEPSPEPCREPGRNCSNARDPRLTTRRAPLAGVTARKPRLSIALADVRPDDLSALRDTSGLSAPADALRC